VIAFEVLTGDVDGIPTAFVVPAIPEAASPQVRGAIARRRLATVSGVPVRRHPLSDHGAVNGVGAPVNACSGLEHERSAGMPTRAPTGLGPSGRRLWRAIMGAFDLAEHEQSLLQQAARTADELDALQLVIAAEGVMAPVGRVHPALIESRQLRLALSRLLTSLRVPDEDGVQPQRRGIRGAYRPSA
jgi:hypothetical protein